MIKIHLLLLQPHFSVNINDTSITTIENKGDVPSQVEITFQTVGVTNGYLKNVTTEKKIGFNSLNRNVFVDTNLGKKKAYYLNNRIKVQNLNKDFCYITQDKVSNILYVATQTNMILKTKDLENFELLTCSNNQNLEIYSIAYSPYLSMFVAVGIDTNANKSVIFSSSDGATWAEVYNKSSTRLNAVVYVDTLSIFVAVGTKGLIVTSYDGTTWVERTSGTDEELKYVIYGEGGGKFITNKVISSDGNTWTINNNVPNIKCTFSKKLNLYAGIFAGNNNKYGVKISSDGENWTITKDNISDTTEDICYSEYEEKFILITNYQWYGNHNKFALSTDCVTWGAFQDLPTNNNILNCFYNEVSKEIVVSGAGVFISTIDFDSWENSFSLNDMIGRIQRLIYIETYDKYYMVGDSPAGSTTTPKKSVDGRNWESTTSNQYYICADIAYSKRLNKIITVGTFGEILKSTDGENFEIVNHSLGIGSLYTVDFSDVSQLFVAGGNGEIISSSDGENWTIRGQFSNIYRIAHSTRTSFFVAVGLNGLIVTSNDGVNWIERTSGTNGDLYGVAYSENNDCFIAVGTNGLIIKSTDGINWTQVSTEITEELHDVMYCPDNIGFVCVGYNGLIATSKDGNTWTKYYNFYGATLTTSVHKGADILIGGDNATLLKLEEVAGENCIDIISVDSDMSFNLDVGMNNMLIQKATGGMSASLKFRQKYIGV